MPGTLVAGIGNVLMGGGATGPFCVRRLQGKYDFPPDARLMDLGAPGLDLTLHIAGADIVLLIDSLRSGAPGGVRVFSKDEILSPRYNGAAHRTPRRILRIGRPARRNGARGNGEARTGRPGGTGRLRDRRPTAGQPGERRFHESQRSTRGLQGTSE